MRLKNYIMLFALVALMVSCGADGTNGKNGSNPAYAEFGASETEAIEAAQNFIRLEYATDAIFQDNGTIVEATQVPDRYKVMQRFDSESKDGYNFVYRIWVQKFPTGWEYGNLGIERAGGERILTLNGRMKEMEQRQMLSPQDGSADGVDFTIIKKNAPNYVRVYTSKRLEREDILKIYNQLKDQYEIIQYSTSRNPNDDDYLSIHYGSVYEYDIDRITKFENY